MESPFGPIQFSSMESPPDYDSALAESWQQSLPMLPMLNSTNNNILATLRAKYTYQGMFQSLKFDLLQIHINYPPAETEKLRIAFNIISKEAGQNMLFEALGPFLTFFLMASIVIEALFLPVNQDLSQPRQPNPILIFLFISIIILMGLLTSILKYNNYRLAKIEELIREKIKGLEDEMIYLSFQFERVDKDDFYLRSIDGDDPIIFNNEHVYEITITRSSDTDMV
jgi:hypothetical protein